MTMKPAWKTAAVALFTVAFLFGGLFGDRLLAITDETRAAMRDYTELLSVVHDGSGSEVKYSDLVSASIQGMLRTLDPHSSYLPPDSYETMRERQQSSFYGLGILVGRRNGQLTVITPIEGTPASRLGIRAGDIISRIEDEPTEAMTINEAVRKLKGPKGTQVRIHIVRSSLDEPLELTITRDEIPQNSVRYTYMLDETTGYLALVDFNRGTGDEMAQAIEDLKQAGMERLLLDLRFNGGGLLDQAIEVADLFLPSGASIVETRGRARGADEKYGADSDTPDVDLPVVALVNGSTASAAEILAGAIQDHDIGLVAGSSTWGKGLVQTVYSLSYGSGIALTTAKYYTPSGRLIQRDYSSWYDYHTRANVGENGDTAAGEDGEQVASAEVFFTDLGREVFGGGGITPDVQIEAPEAPQIAQRLAGRNAFFDFAVDYANRGLVDSESWSPPENLSQIFADWVVERDLLPAEEVEDALADAEVASYLSNHLHAEIIGASFGLEARHKILARTDPQIQEAIDLFGPASELQAERRRLGDRSQELTLSPRG